MAKMRGFKPDLWSDDDFVEASPLARLLWLGMWNHACDNGHLPDKPRQIKRKVLPADEESGETLVGELADLGLIVRKDGWITVPNLSKHQKIDMRYFLACDYPGCEKPATSERETRRGNAGATPGPQRGHTLPHDEGEGEGEGEERKPSADKSATRSKRLPDDFAPNETNRRIAQERGLNLEAVVEQFKDHHAAKGSKFIDWHRALNTWLRREKPNPAAAPVAPPAAPRVVARQCDNRHPHPRHDWQWQRNHHRCEGVQT